MAKLILTIGGMILASFYGPSSYGIYTVFLSYVMILPVLSTMRLESVLILQKGSREIRNLFSATVVISTLITAIVIGGICLWKYFDISEVSLNYYLLILCGIGGLITAWNNTQNSMFSKYKFFNQISQFFLISSLFSVLSQTIFYFAGFTELGLIYGWIVGLLAGFIFNLRVAKSRFEKIDWQMARISVRENKKVITYTYPSDSINAVANNIMPILVLSYFTSAEVGLYGMAFKILSTPLVLLSGAISKVYFQKSFTLFNHDRRALKFLTYKVILATTGLMFLFVLFMNTIGVYILDYFLNDKWHGIGEFLWILSIWILARTALNCISSVIIVLKKNIFSLIFNIYLLLVNLLAVYIGVIYEDFTLCVWVFSILSSIGYLALLGMVIYNLNKYERQ